MYESNNISIPFQNCRANWSNQSVVVSIVVSIVVSTVTVLISDKLKF